MHGEDLKHRSAKAFTRRRYTQLGYSYSESYSPSLNTSTPYSSRHTDFSAMDMSEVPEPMEKPLLWSTGMGMLYISDRVL